MRKTSFEEIAAEAAAPEPPQLPTRPRFEPRVLRSHVRVTNRIRGEMPPFGSVECTSLAEARELARRRALTLLQPIYEVGPDENLRDVAHDDGVYIVIEIVDELSGQRVFNTQLARDIAAGIRRG